VAVPTYLLIESLYGFGIQGDNFSITNNTRRVYFSPASNDAITLYSHPANELTDDYSNCTVLVPLSG